jgi:KaiC/GvpD/RAD55 family RecA-like ATPase
MRDLGHGHYERQKVDLIADPSWGVLVKEHRELASMDLVRFTFELDDAVEEIRATVATIFGPARSMARS